MTTTTPSKPELLPELLNRVIEIAKGDFDARDEDFQSFLAQISLVCRMWAEEARRFIFNSVVLAFGSKQERPSNSDSTNPGGEQPLAALRQRAKSLIHQALGRSQNTVPRTLRRVEKFLILTRCNPQIATSVRHLQLFAAEMNATEELNASADVLLEIFSTLSNIRSVKVTMRPETRHIRQDWWYDCLEDTARVAITFLLSRPTLEDLSLEVATIPCAIWDPHPLKSVVIMESLCKDTPATSVLRNESHSPDETLNHWPEELDRMNGAHPQDYILPQAFGQLSCMSLYEKFSHMEDIRRVLLRSRKTLTTLRLHLRTSHQNSDSQPSTPIPILDLGTHMEKLHTLYFEPTFYNRPSEEGCTYVFQTLDTLPWAQITSLHVRLNMLRCPSSAHSPFHPQDYCNGLDSLIWRRAMMPIHSDVTPGTAKPELQYVACVLNLRMCDTCRPLVAASVPSPPPWKIQDLFPLLHSAVAREELGITVDVKWSGPQGSQRQHFLRCSVPPQMEEAARFMNKVL